VTAVPLSLLVDRMAGDGRRDEAFVRRLSSWLHANASRLELDAIERLGLVDVVLTFRMKGVVTLVATGRHPDVPGEVTLRFVETDFPFLRIAALERPRDAPYEVCTLDHSVEGRPVEVVADGAWPLPAGTRATAIVDSTVGERRVVRVRPDLPGGEVVNVPAECVRWLDEGAETGIGNA
jgi:hypothetical protein